MKLSELVIERDTLAKQLEKQGGRGIELADEIDALDRRIRRLKHQRAERLAREVAKHDGVGTYEFCESCARKVARIVRILDSC